jgi:hypothetical protein
MKATEVSVVMIRITLVSYLISSFQRPIRPPMKLETAKRTPTFERTEKNEAIICRKCIPHHKRGSSFLKRTRQPDFIFSLCCRDIVE